MEETNAFWEIAVYQCAEKYSPTTSHSSSSDDGTDVIEPSGPANSLPSNREAII